MSDEFTIMTLARDLANARHKVDEAQSARQRAEAHYHDCEKKLAHAVCPLRKDQLVGIGKSQLFQVSSIKVDMASNGRQARWSCSGRTVRIEHGREVWGQTATLMQSDYEALPKQVRELSLDDLRAADQEKALRLKTRKLSMGEGHMGMLAHCLQDRTGPGLSTHRVPQGVLWATDAGTAKIWRDLVARGVLALTQGKIEDPTRLWGIDRGPRFDEALEMIEAQRQLRAKQHRQHRP